jgi:hypothetical protein
MKIHIDDLAARISALEESDPQAGAYYCNTLKRAASYPAGCVISNDTLRSLDRDLTELELAAWQRQYDAEAAVRRAKNAANSARCAANKQARRMADRAATTALKSASGKGR